jgi:hypothetical protein
MLRAAVSVPLDLLLQSACQLRKLANKPKEHSDEVGR